MIESKGLLPDLLDRSAAPAAAWFECSHGALVCEWSLQAQRSPGMKPHSALSESVPGSARRAGALLPRCAVGSTGRRGEPADEHPAVGKIGRACFI